MQHLLVTRDFLPELTGAARRYVALARRFPEPMSVSTVAARDAARHDAAEDYAIDRQRFTSTRAPELLNRIRWQRWLTRRCRARVHVLHCGDIGVAGRVVWRTHKRAGIPYILYVNAQELRRAGLGVEVGDGAWRLKKSFEAADKLARKMIIVGEDEVNSGVFTVKDFSKGEQVKLSRTELVSALKS